MLHATRSLLHRWHRELSPDGTQRRRALLARDRRERASSRYIDLLKDESEAAKHYIDLLSTEHKRLADLFKALQERVPVYTRVQEDERRYGRTFVVTVAFNPEVIVRTLLFNTAERDRSIDLENEFFYLVDAASKKILAALREAAAERLGIPGRTR